MQVSDEVFVGIDPSSKKMAVALLDGEELHILSVSSLDQSLMKRLWVLSTGVSEFIDNWTMDSGRDIGDVIIYIEEPVVGRNVRSTLVQSQAQGAVLRDLYGYSVYQVNNKTWKKDVVRNGAAGKPQIAQWLKDNHPVYYDQAAGDQDVIDAIVICLFARSQYELSQRFRSSIP